MNATIGEELRVEQSSTIRQRPDLSQAAESATRYLSSQLNSHTNVFGNNRALTWQFLPDYIDGPRVAVGYGEEDALGARHITRWIRPEELVDPVLRDVHMLRLLQDILKQRWKQVDRVSRDHLRALESEEEHGRAH
jgi:hypothetical protein